MKSDKSDKTAKELLGTEKYNELKRLADEANRNSTSGGGWKVAYVHKKET